MSQLDNIEELVRKIVPPGEVETFRRWLQEDMGLTFAEAGAAQIQTRYEEWVEQTLEDESS